MNNKVLIGIIIVLVGVIIAEGVYLFTSKKEENENNSYINIPKEEEEENESNDDETSEDYVKLVNTKEEDNQVIQEYEMVLNGEYQEFDIIFEINEGEGYWDIDSTLGDSNIFAVWYDTAPPNNYVDFIAQYFNENNFIIFPGIDGVNYLIIQGYREPPAGGPGLRYYIFNQWNSIGFLDVVYQGQGIFLEDESIWYPNNLFIDSLKDEKQIRSKIEGDRIYNLYYTCEAVGDDLQQNLEERVYTINHDKLEYEVINTYTDLEVAGATC